MPSKVSRPAIKTSCLLAGLLAVMVSNQGCFLVVLGGAAGAAVGGYAYSANALEATRDVSLDRAWQAANGALKELQIPVTLSKKDGLSGRLEGRNVQDQRVIIQLQRQADRLTKIDISVGTFDNAQNRSAAQLIYDKMDRRF